MPNTSNKPGEQADADKLAAHFQEIEPRFDKETRRRHKRPKDFSWPRQRWRDLQVILQHRYPEGVPDRINAEDLLFVDAQTLGNSLGLTAEERKLWGITTIRACDETPAEATARRKVERAERERVRRHDAGAVSREWYLAGERSRPRPWEVLGISKATYYRHLRDAVRGETGSVPTPYLNKLGTHPVSRKGNAATDMVVKQLLRLMAMASNHPGPGGQRHGLRSS